VVEKTSADDGSVRRLLERFEDPRLLRACYEAGPTGYDLCRLLRSMGAACEVIAPSLIPKASGDKVKTHKRDCQRLARLYRAGAGAHMTADATLSGKSWPPRALVGSSAIT
jgi:transposase